MIDVKELVDKLIGEIQPIGETNFDEHSFKNLKEYTSLIERMVVNALCVSSRADSDFYSVSQSGKFAKNFLLGIKKLIEDET